MITLKCSNICLLFLVILSTFFVTFYVYKVRQMYVFDSSFDLVHQTPFGSFVVVNNEKIRVQDVTM